MTDPFDPRPCCIFQVCCGGNSVEAQAKRRSELAVFLEKNTPHGPDDSFAGTVHTLLDHFDIVPKGLGAAIVEAYRPSFEEHYRGGIKS